MSLTASIVIPTYNRASLLRQTLVSILDQDFPHSKYEIIVIDDGSTDNTEAVVNDFAAVRYIRLDRPGWTNPSVPLNVGIRQAKGDIVVLEGAEVKHTNRGNLRGMVSLVQATPKTWVFAHVDTEADPAQGGGTLNYCSSYNPRPFWFLCAIKRQHLLDIRGLDEDYTDPGYDDVDLADRLIRGLGITPLFTRHITALHQWHEPSPFNHKCEPMKRLYEQKSADWAMGRISHVRNLDREWGANPPQDL